MATKEIARKITISTVAGKAVKWFEQVMKAEGKPVPLCRLYGSATGYKMGATEFGEYCTFRGMFRGLNLTTGETQDAPQIILPDHLGEMLKSAIEGAKGEPVSFAFEISAVFDVTVATKYKFIAESTLPAVKNNPLAELENQMAEAGFALPVPAKAPLTLPPVKAAETPVEAAKTSAAAPDAKGKGK